MKYCQTFLILPKKNIYPEVKLDIHVFSKATGVVVPQCLGVTKSLTKGKISFG